MSTQICKECKKELPFTGFKKWGQRYVKNCFDCSKKIDKQKKCEHSKRKENCDVCSVKCCHGYTQGSCAQCKQKLCQHNFIKEDCQICPNLIECPRCKLKFEIEEFGKSGQLEKRNKWCIKCTTRENKYKCCEHGKRKERCQVCLVEKSIKNPIIDNWVDAIQMNEKYPNDFYYPEEEVSKLTEKKIVKICNGEERFWVQIESIDGDDIIGVVDNVLLSTKYTSGSHVIFQKKNIYEIYDP